MSGAGPTWGQILDTLCPTCGVPDGWVCHPGDGFHSARVRAAADRVGRTA